jgi:hypothetical protein
MIELIQGFLPSPSHVGVSENTQGLAAIMSTVGGLAAAEVAPTDAVLLCLMAMVVVVVFVMVVVVFVVVLVVVA